jgi:hypothetical protein
LGEGIPKGRGGGLRVISLMGSITSDCGFVGCVANFSPPENERQNPLIPGERLIGGGFNRRKRRKAHLLLGVFSESGIMGIKKIHVEVNDLTEDNLMNVPEWDSHPFSCKYCIYWEFPEDSVNPKLIKEELIQKKLQWLQNTMVTFGNCGKIAYINGKPVGYAEYAPPKLLPRSVDYQSGPPSDDAVLISCLFIPHEKHRGVGVGNRLLQSIIEDSKERGLKAIETFARKDNPNNPSGPLDFYLKNEFKIHRNDSEFPLVRLEL